MSGRRNKSNEELHYKLKLNESEYTRLYKAYMLK